MDTQHINDLQYINELLDPNNTTVRVTPTVPLGEIEILPENGDTLPILLNSLLRNGYDVFVTADSEGVIMLSYSRRDYSYGAPQHLWIEQP